MRKVITAIIAITSILFISCTRDNSSINSNQIVGSWNLIKTVHIERNASTSAIISNDTLYETLPYSTFDFRSNGTNIVTQGSSGSTITWNYKVEGNKLISWDTSLTSADTVQIISLNNNSLTWYYGGIYNSNGINIQWDDWTYLTK